MTDVTDEAADDIEISVVVPTYRRPQLLARMVAALEAQTLDRERFEVLVVDNGSDDDTSTVLAGLAAASPLHLRPLRVDVNAGPAPARNLGWRSARGRFVAFTDDDCIPRSDWLEQGLAVCGASPGLGVLQGATLRPAGHPPIGPLTLYRETTTPSPYFEGCNLFFPRAVLERSGGFDETFPFGGEDTAAGWAAIEQGEWLFDESTVVTHDVSERPLGWHLRMAWREGNLLDVAARYPGLRRHAFWRPWAHRRTSVAFPLAALGLVAALRWRPAALAALPWLWLRRPPLSRRDAPRVLAVRALNDAVVCAGMLNASVRNRTLAL